MKKIILLFAIALVSCQETHSPEYYKALEDYNKAHNERLKVEAEYDSLVKDFQDSVLNKGK
jgi:hypothetical protein